MEPTAPAPQPSEAPELPNEVIHRVMELAGGSDVAKAAINHQWKDVGDDQSLWRQKYQEEYGSKPPAMPSSPPIPPADPAGSSADWKTKYATEKKIEQQVEKVETQGMYFVRSGDREARLQFFNPQNNNQFNNYQIVYTAPGQAKFQQSSPASTPSASSSSSSSAYGNIAGLTFEGEHDNIARPDWKNFKPPKPDEEPALMYAYSPDASDVDFRERTRRK